VEVLQKWVPNMWTFFLPNPYKGPTLFIRGALSNYIPKSRFPMYLQWFPNSTLVEMQTGHLPHAEKPQEFVDVVMKWMHEH
jgi:pimeloyl-ACP methyl ester carboxylesterase